METKINNPSIIDTGKSGDNPLPTTASMKAELLKIYPNPNLSSKLEMTSMG